MEAEKEFEIQMDYTIEDFYAYWKGFGQKKAGKAAPKAMTSISPPAR